MGRLWCAGAHCAKSLIIPLIPTNRPPRASRLLSCHRAVGCKRPGLEHLFGGALANDIGFLRAWENLRWGQIFEHKARRAWWATHLDARRRSGVTRTEYCRLHRLTKSTFDRWLSALNSLESAREEARKRRKRAREPVSGDKHNKAVQPFAWRSIDAHSKRKMTAIALQLDGHWEDCWTRFWIAAGSTGTRRLTSRARVLRGQSQPQEGNHSTAVASRNQCQAIRYLHPSAYRSWERPLSQRSLLPDRKSVV